MFQRAGARAELAVEPGFLRHAEIGAARVEPLRAGSVDQLLAAAARRPVAGQSRAVLPPVEHQKRREIAEIGAAVERHVRPARQRRERQRHVLPEGVIRRRAARQKADGSSKFCDQSSA